MSRTGTRRRLRLQRFFHASFLTAVRRDRPNTATYSVPPWSYQGTIRFAANQRFPAGSCDDGQAIAIGLVGRRQDMKWRLRRWRDDTGHRHRQCADRTPNGRNASFLRLGHLHHGLADADKGVHHPSAFFVNSLHFSAKSALQEIDERPSIRGKQARSNMPQTHTDIVGAEAGRNEPVVTEGVRDKCGAFAIGPVGGLADTRSRW